MHTLNLYTLTLASRATARRRPQLPLHDSAHRAPCRTATLYDSTPTAASWSRSHVVRPLPMAHRLLQTEDSVLNSLLDNYLGTSTCGGEVHHKSDYHRANHRAAHTLQGQEAEHNNIQEMD